MIRFRRHPKLEWLSRMLDGMLDERDQQTCQRHLASCIPCQNLLEGLGHARAALQALLPIEEHPIQQLQPPMFIPVIRTHLGPWFFGAGLLLGVLGVGLLVLRLVNLPMRVVSAPSVEGIQALKDMKLEPGVPLRTLLPGDVDLEIPNQILLRLRPGATITWQQFNRPWIIGGRPKIVLNVMQGDVLARTQNGFWGSRLEVRTPTANAMVKGTAFSVSVDPKNRSATVLKVLAGSVFFSPYLEGVGVKVRSGQESRIRDSGFPDRPRLLSSEERKALLETYRIGQEPRVALVIGAGPERVEELLEPALLYLSAQDHPDLHPFIRRLVLQVNAGILENDLASRQVTLRALEIAVENLRDPMLSVPLRLFVGACRVRLGQIREGRVHFRWVAANVPQDPLVPLALGALARTAEHLMRNAEMAQVVYHQIASHHPKSPEATLAREFLRRYTTTHTQPQVRGE